MNSLFILTLASTMWISSPNVTDTVTVEITGLSSEARFQPAVVQVDPGDVIRFIVREGLHTVTAYHPDNRRPRRTPEGTNSFDSGLLEKGDVWFWEAGPAGVYDYYCLPHERMGHAGRIISGSFKNIPDYPVGQIPNAVIKTIDKETRNFLTKQNP